MARGTMTIQLSSESLDGRYTYYAEQELPAFKGQLEDAKQRARFRDDGSRWERTSVTSCSWIPFLEDYRLDTTTPEEMNFLARRLEGLNEEEERIYRALFEKRIAQSEEPDPVSVKDLINMTYDLDTVMVAANVADDEALGQFVIDNELQEDVNAIPEDSLYLLDKAAIGRLQRENDGGIYQDGCYIATESYTLPEIYDGIYLPKMPETDAVFRMLICSREEERDPGKHEWVELPMEYMSSHDISLRHGELFIEDCLCLELQSAILPITGQYYTDTYDFGTMNTIAERYASMTSEEQIKYKAILEGEEIHDPEGMLLALDALEDYELGYEEEHPGTFFQHYLAQHLEPGFDTRWLDHLESYSERVSLLQRLGGKVTSYGMLSQRGHSLYELVSFEEEPEEEFSHQNEMWQWGGMEL